MLAALFSFLGGSVFRMIWGEISTFLNKRQDHAHEVELMRIQAELDKQAHDRTLETLRLQSELGVKQVQVQAEAAIEKADADAFSVAMANAFKPSGIKFVDAWNGIIRPSYATVGLVLWAIKLYAQGFKMDDFDVTLFGTIAGFFFADRSLGKRGK